MCTGCGCEHRDSSSRRLGFNRDGAFTEVSGSRDHSRWSAFLLGYRLPVSFARIPVRRAEEHDRAIYERDRELFWRSAQRMNADRQNVSLAIVNR